MNLLTKQLADALRESIRRTLTGESPTRQQIIGRADLLAAYDAAKDAPDAPSAQSEDDQEIALTLATDLRVMAHQSCQQLVKDLRLAQAAWLEEVADRVVAKARPNLQPLHDLVKSWCVLCRKWEGNDGKNYDDGLLLCADQLSEAIAKLQSAGEVTP